MSESVERGLIRHCTIPVSIFGIRRIGLANYGIIHSNLTRPIQSPSYFECITTCKWEKCFLAQYDQSSQNCTMIYEHSWTSLLLQYKRLYIQNDYQGIDQSRYQLSINYDVIKFSKHSYDGTRFSRYKGLWFSMTRVIGEPMEMWTDTSYKSCLFECRNMVLCDLFEIPVTKMSPRMTRMPLVYSCLLLRYKVLKSLEDMKSLNRRATWMATEHLREMKHPVRPMIRVARCVHLSRPKLDKDVANSLIVLANTERFWHGTLKYRFWYLSIQFSLLILGDMYWPLMSYIYNLPLLQFNLTIISLANFQNDYNSYRAKANI